MHELALGGTEEWCRGGHARGPSAVVGAPAATARYSRALVRSFTLHDVNADGQTDTDPAPKWGIKGRGFCSGATRSPRAWWASHFRAAARGGSYVHQDG